MTEPGENKQQESAAVVEGRADKSTRRGRLMRGCGCLTGLLLLGLGILVIGNFDSTSWASALIAITIGILVFALSGVNGIWEDES
jgi:uncharacterized membrane protein YqjE